MQEKRLFACAVVTFSILLLFASKQRFAYDEDHLLKRGDSQNGKTNGEPAVFEIYRSVA